MHSPKLFSATLKTQFSDSLLILGKAMYSSTFTFAKGQYDDEFYRLDEAIAKVAKAIPGYLGEETWENLSTGLISNVYYWSSLEALQQLIDHPTHVQAKTAQAKWLNGYQVVIAQVLQAYADGKISHPLRAMSEIRQPEKPTGVSPPP